MVTARMIYFPVWRLAPQPSARWMAGVTGAASDDAGLAQWFCSESGTVGRGGGAVIASSAVLLGVSCGCGCGGLLSPPLLCCWVCRVGAGVGGLLSPPLLCCWVCRVGAGVGGCYRLLCCAVGCVVWVLLGVSCGCGCGGLLSPPLLCCWVCRVGAGVGGCYRLLCCAVGCVVWVCRVGVSCGCVVRVSHRLLCCAVGCVVWVRVWGAVIASSAVLLGVSCGCGCGGLLSPPLLCCWVCRVGVGVGGCYRLLCCRSAGVGGIASSAVLLGVSCGCGCGGLLSPPLLCCWVCRVGVGVGGIASSAVLLGVSCGCGCGGLLSPPLLCCWVCRVGAGVAVRVSQCGCRSAITEEEQRPHLLSNGGG